MDLVSHNGYAAAGPTGRLCDRLKLGTQNGLSPEFFCFERNKIKTALTWQLKKQKRERAATKPPSRSHRRCARNARTDVHVHSANTLSSPQVSIYHLGKQRRTSCSHAAYLHQRAQGVARALRRSRKDHVDAPGIGCVTVWAASWDRLLLNECDFES